MRGSEGRRDGAARRVCLTQQRFFSLYATAPEQLLGSSVCVGTDVYALGGLLYELLSGAPLISRELKTPAQLQMFIVEKTPTLPSRNIDAAAASNRSAASVAKLSANLAGDLDRIVLHALRKLPSERYASAREFDEDIQAFLEHRPVKAAGQASVIVRVSSCDGIGWRRVFPAWRWRDYWR